MASTDQLTAGDVVASYCVERMIARGGMGVVYQARDERLERPVALKILAPHLAGDEAFRERLLREGRIAPYASQLRVRITRVAITGADARVWYRSTLGSERGVALLVNVDGDWLIGGFRPL